MSKVILFTCFFVFSSVFAYCPYGIIKSGVNSNDKRNILAQHNNLRYKLSKGLIRGQPRGVNFKTLKWDESLAREAQRVANSCEFRHQKAHSNKWWWVGQNLAWSATTDVNDKNSNWNQSMNSWFKEYKRYKFGRGYNHYTQAVWADTEYIGCAFTVYRKNDGWTYNKLYVCHYGPGGNIKGQTPYKRA